MSAIVVHLLYAGFPLCRFSDDQPTHWPKGHVWVDKNERRLCTCEECKQKADEVFGIEVD